MRLCYQLCRNALFWVLIVITTVPLSLGTAGPDKPIEKIIKDWIKRRDRIQTGRFEIESQVLIPKGIYTKTPGLPAKASAEVPASDYRFNSILSLVLDFQRNWIKKEIHEQVFNISTGVFEPVFEINVFDGSKFIGFTPRNENGSVSARQPDIYIGTKFNGGFFDYQDVPILFAMGVFNGRNSDPRNSRVALNSEGFEVWSFGTHNEHKCLVVRRGPTSSSPFLEEYWVDPEYENSVVKWIQYIEEKPSVNIEIAYQRTPFGYIPTSWNTDTFRNVSTKKIPSGHNQLQLSLRGHLVKYEINTTIEPNEFKIDLQPGMNVDNMDKDRLYKVQPDGSMRPFDSLQSTNTWLRWIIVSIILFLLVFFTLRRRRRGQPIDTSKHDK